MYLQRQMHVCYIHLTHKRLGGEPNPSVFGSGKISIIKFCQIKYAELFTVATPCQGRYGLLTLAYLFNVQHLSSFINCKRNILLCSCQFYTFLYSQQTNPNPFVHFRIDYFLSDFREKGTTLPPAQYEEDFFFFKMFKLKVFSINMV